MRISENNEIPFSLQLSRKGNGSIFVLSLFLRKLSLFKIYRKSVGNYCNKNFRKNIFTLSGSTEITETGREKLHCSVNGLIS